MEFLMVLILFILGTIYEYKVFNKKKKEIMKNVEKRGGFYKDQSEIDFLEGMKHPVRYVMLNNLLILWCTVFSFWGFIWMLECSLKDLVWLIEKF